MPTSLKLHRELEHFHAAVRAACVPIGDGAYRVHDEPGACLLSDAADRLAAVLIAQRDEVFRVFGDPAGPAVDVVAVGGVGAPADLVAAISRATAVVAWSAKQWNEQQADNPGGDHPRYRMGDRITADELALLDTVPRLLALNEPDDGVDVVVDEEQEDDDVPALALSDRLVLTAMAGFDGRVLLSVDEVMLATDKGEARLASSTVANAIRQLVKAGLVERPQGDRRGARLTRQGRMAAKKIGS